MAARTSWKGALEFAGITINVRLYPRKKSRSGDSFKSLGKDGQPIDGRWRDRTSGEVLDRKVDTRQGVEVKPGEWKAIDSSIFEALSKSEVLEPEGVFDVSTIPVDLAMASYDVYPDKVAGADRNVNWLWNGLLHTQTAYVAKIQMRDGSRDSILAIYARGDGLYAVSLPFADEVYGEPEASPFEVDKKAQELFAQFLGAGEYATGSFYETEIESGWRKLQEKAIAAVQTGKAPRKAKAKPSKQPGNDLMDALIGAVENRQKPGRKPTRGGRGKSASRKSQPTTRKAKVKA